MEYREVRVFKHSPEERAVMAKIAREQRANRKERAEKAKTQ
jgi:hypothetical protein